MRSSHNAVSNMGGSDRVDSTVGGAEAEWLFRGRKGITSVHVRGWVLRSATGREQRGVSIESPDPSPDKALIVVRKMVCGAFAPPGQRRASPLQTHENRARWGPRVCPHLVRDARARRF